jgi:hypothetical protein
LLVFGRAEPRPTRNKLAIKVLGLESYYRGEMPMRKLILAAAAAAIITAPMATVVRAEDTTIIKKHDDGDKTVIKKKDEVNVLPVPHVEEKKTIIRKDND